VFVRFTVFPSRAYWKRYGGKKYKKNVTTNITPEDNILALKSLAGGVDYYSLRLFFGGISTQFVGTGWLAPPNY
jgi:hypothetical protein